MPGSKISISLEAQFAQYSEATAKAAKDTNSLRETMEHLKRSTAGSDAFDKIREGLGRRSAIGEASELMRGGGPISGLTGAAEAIKGMADQAAKLNQEFESGKLSAGEMTGEIAKGLPIVGQFWEAGQAIRNVFTGEGDDMAMANTNAKVLEASISAVHSEMELTKKETKEFDQYMAEAAKETAKLTLSAGEAEKAIAKIALEQKLKNIEEQKEAAIKAAEAAAKPAKDAAAAANNESGKGDPSVLTRIGAYFGGRDLAEEQRGRELSAQQAALARDTVGRAEQQAVQTATDNAAKEAKAARDNAALEAQQAAKENSARLKEVAEKDAKEIRDVEAAADEASLRAKGQDYEADKRALQRELDDKRQAIEKEAADRSRQPGANQSQIDEMAGVKLVAAAKENAAKQAALAHDEEKKHAAKADDISEKITNDIVDQAMKVKEFQKANESAADKYRDQLAEIEKYKGQVSEDVYNSAIAKANAELVNSAHNEQEKKVGAQVRRFDFNIGKEKTVDPIQQMAADQKANRKSSERMEFYLQQLYQTGVLNKSDDDNTFELE